MHLFRWLLVIVGCTAIGASSDVSAIESAEDRLSRVEYRLFGRTAKGVAREVSYEGSRVSLELFDDRLAQFYTLHMDYEDVLEVELLSTGDSIQIRRAWRARQLERDEEREAARREREESEAREAQARRASGQGSAKSATGTRRPKGTADAGSDRSRSEVERIRLEDPAELLKAMQTEITGLEKTLGETHGRYSDLDALRRDKRVRKSLEGRRFLAAVGKIGRRLERGKKQVDRANTKRQEIEQAMKDGELDLDEARSRAELSLRQLAALANGLEQMGREIVESEKKADTIRASLGPVVAADGDVGNRETARRGPVKVASSSRGNARALPREPRREPEPTGRARESAESDERVIVAAQSPDASSPSQSTPDDPDLAAEQDETTTRVDRALDSNGGSPLLQFVLGALCMLVIGGLVLFGLKSVRTQARAGLTANTVTTE